MSDKKEYLGDAVYVDTDGAYIILTTEDGIRATNPIYLELPVYDSLVKWVERLREQPVPLCPPAETPAGERPA